MTCDYTEIAVLDTSFEDCFHCICSTTTTTTTKKTVKVLESDRGDVPETVVLDVSRTTRPIDVWDWIWGPVTTTTMQTTTTTTTKKPDTVTLEDTDYVEYDLKAEERTRGTTTTTTTKKPDTVTLDIDYDEYDLKAEERTRGTTTTTTTKRPGFDILSG